MKTWTGASMRIHSALLVLCIAVVAVGWRSAAPPKGLPQPGNPPEDIGFDPEPGLGHGWPKHPLGERVKKWEENGEFRNSPGGPISLPTGNGTTCRVSVKLRNNSHNIPKMANGKHYIVGLLEAVDDCKTKWFKLDKGDRAAWYVHVTNTQAGLNDHAGKTGLILLGGFFSNDKKLHDFAKSRLGVCGHTSSTVDEFHLLTRDTRCSIHPRFRPVLATDTTRIGGRGGRGRGGRGGAGGQPVGAQFDSVIVVDSLPAGDPGDGGDDPSFWFACGGDCCHTSLQRM